MPPRKRLGQLLTELGVIDDHQLQSALGHQRQWGGKLGAILVQKGFCGEEQLVAALAQHLSMPRVKLAEARIDPKAVKLVSRQIAEKLHVFPYEVSGSGRSEVISIAMSDPTDLSAVDQLAFHTGKRIKPMLASDSEVVAAIQAHYGPSEEKKESTDKVPRPTQTAAQATAAPGFPRRIEPQAAAGAMAPKGAVTAPAASATAAVAPAEPPKAAAPAPKADREEAPPATAAPAAAAPTPVELPEDDADDLGLEPIAAHSQFGGDVAGKEEVAGEGSAGDAIEGLVSASLAHEGTGQAAASSAPVAAWPDAEEPPQHQQDPGWGTPVQSTGEGWGAPGAAPAAVTWSADAAASGWSMEEPSTSAGWSAPERGEAWADVPGPPDEAPSEALPTDAILGALEPSPEQDTGRAESSGWDVDEPGERSAPVAVHKAAASADERSASEPAAEAAAAEPATPPAPTEEVPPVSFERDSDERDAPMSASAPESEAFAEIPQRVLASNDDLPSPSATAEAAGHSSMDTEPIAPPTFASPASDHEAEAPDAWSATEDPLAADAHQHEAAWREVEANAEAAVQAATQEFAHPVPGLAEGLGSEREQSTTADDGDTESIDVDTASFEEEADSAAPTRSEAPAPEAAEPHPPAAEATERFAAQPEPEQPRWSGPEAEPEAQGARWIGEALEGSTPLSPADLGTLASIGVTPGDGVGALRLLAALVRILNRSQLIEPDDLRAEIRESREAGAAAAAAEPPNGAESESSSAESSTAAET